MEWTEAVIKTVSGGVELITGLLMEIGINGLVVEDEYETSVFLRENEAHWDYADEALLNKQKGVANIKFYTTADAYGNEQLVSVRNGLEMLRNGDFFIETGELSLTVNNVNDDNWLENWKKYYKSFKIGGIVIKPVWEPYERQNSELIFNINPGLVFGTGLHQSTQLCVNELERRVKQGDVLLDIGCGSGILSIIALLLGASRACAIDTEPTAAAQAVENAGLNNIDGDRYEVFTGNILKDKKILDEISKKRYDIVTANIIADVIIALAPLVPQFIRSGGLFISSGIIKDRADETQAALTDNGFKIISQSVKDEWVCICAERI